MITEKFTVFSPYDNLELFCVARLPDGERKGVIQIVHGMCEYKRRYEEMLDYFAENGYIAVAYDQRGHGETAKTKEGLGWFGDKTGEAIVDDAAAVTDTIKQRYPNLPFTLFGHSMGSMIVRCYLQKYDEKIDKLIVCGSPSSNPLASAGILLAKAIGKVKGERHRSKMLADISTGNNNKRFPGEGKSSWLSRNRANIDEYNADPYSGFAFTCNGFENLFRLMKNTYTASRYKVKNPKLPIRFISGGDDAVLVSEEKWLKSHQLLRDVGYENVSGKLYHGLRHEIHNELERAEVLADILAFIETDSF